MNLKNIPSINEELKITLFVVAVAIGFSVYTVINRIDDRITPADYDQIETMSIAKQKMLNDTLKTNELPPLWNSWSVLKNVAELYNVKLTIHENTAQKQYEGPAASWHAALTGKPKDVFASLIAIQKAAPVHANVVRAVEGNALATISLLGVEQ